MTELGVGNQSESDYESIFGGCTLVVGVTKNPPTQNSVSHLNHRMSCFY